MLLLKSKELMNYVRKVAGAINLFFLGSHFCPQTKPWRAASAQTMKQQTSINILKSTSEILHRDNVDGKDSLFYCSPLGLEIIDSLKLGKTTKFI